MRILPEYVIGPSRPGRRIAIACGASDPSGIADLAADCDVLVADANAYDGGRRVDCAAAAARLAAAAQAQCLLLTNLHTEPTRGGGGNGNEAGAMAAAAAASEATVQGCRAVERSVRKHFSGQLHLVEDFHSHVLEKHEGQERAPQEA